MFCGVGNNVQTPPVEVDACTLCSDSQHNAHRSSLGAESCTLWQGVGLRAVAFAHDLRMAVGLVSTLERDV